MESLRVMHINFSCIKKQLCFFICKKIIKLKKIGGGKILLLKNNKNGNCTAASFPLMPHDMPSLRCTLSGWYELPRWREQKPWTVRELRRKPGRRTIQIHRIHSQAASVSGGVAQFQQHSNSLSPVCTNLGGKCRKQNKTLLDKSTIRVFQAVWQSFECLRIITLWSLRRQKEDKMLSLMTRPTCKEMENACGNGGVQTSADTSTKSNQSPKAHQT